MRLFHVSEQPGIEVFHPRSPTRDDMDKATPLVWAISERCLPNFLTPRQCPRVAFHAPHPSPETAEFFSGNTQYCVAIEQGWHERMLTATLYIYEFSPENFRLLDEPAGYFVSEQSERPVGMTRIDNVYAELFKRGVEVRLVSNLWPLAERIKHSPLNWSLCKMANARAPQ